MGFDREASVRYALQKGGGKVIEVLASIVRPKRQIAPKSHGRCMMKWQIEAAAIVLLASVSAARAANITYNILNYPADQIDDIIPGADTISGTIITDGTLGVWNDNTAYPGPIIGGTLTWQGPGGTYSGTIYPGDANTDLSLTGIFFTATQIIVRPGDCLDLMIAAGNRPSNVSICIDYNRINAPAIWHTGNVVDVYAGTLMQFESGEYFGEPWSDGWGGPGSVAANDPWIIATASPGPNTIDWQGGNATNPTNWNVAANWIPNTAVPDGAGTKVSFGNQPAANKIVDMISQGQTVGTMVFSSTASTTIISSGGYSLTLDNAGAVSTIDVTGIHIISAPVVLNNDTTISGTGTLKLTGGITGNHALTVLGNLTATSIQVDTLTIGNNAGVSAVPEPSTIALLLTAALGGLLWWRRRA
jgi:hypothetical protein